MPETEFYCIIITILLPVSIDDSPSRLRTDKLGERSVVLRTDHATAVKTVREVASGVGFSVPTEFFPADRIAKERDTDSHRTPLSASASQRRLNTYLTSATRALGPCSTAV